MSYCDKFSMTSILYFFVLFPISDQFHSKNPVVGQASFVLSQVSRTATIAEWRWCAGSGDPTRHVWNYFLNTVLLLSTSFVCLLRLRELGILTSVCFISEL